jgi:phosphoadenosine phosphosulfate reductase
MLQSRLEESLAILRRAREGSASVLVSFSMGKDSLIVLDMCKRTFERVDGFFMQPIPEELSFQKERLDAYEKIFGVRIHRLPHWRFWDRVRKGAYRDTSFELDGLPKIRLRDVYDTLVAETGIPLIATGMRRAEGLWRQRNLIHRAHWLDVVHPIVGWEKQDLDGYISRHKLPVTIGSGRHYWNPSDIALDPASILYLWDNHPADFEKVEAHFPYIRAIVWRREWHGNPGNYKPRKQRAAA